MTTTNITVHAFLDEIDADLTRLSYSLADQWPGIDRDDIYQEMALKVIENWSGVGKHADRRKIALGLANKAGTAYCSRERYFYQDQTAEWIYTPNEVRALLAEFYLIDAWEDAPKKPEQNQTLTGDGISVALMDIRNALDAAPEADQAVILRAFHQHESLESAERKRLQRSVDRITRFLNNRVSRTFDHHQHDGPGSRTAMSNAQARYQTAKNY